MKLFIHEFRISKISKAGFNKKGAQIYGKYITE